MGFGMRCRVAGNNDRRAFREAQRGGRRARWKRSALFVTTPQRIARASNAANSGGDAVEEPRRRRKPLCVIGEKGVTQIAIAGVVRRHAHSGAEQAPCTARSVAAEVRDRDRRQTVIVGAHAIEGTRQVLRGIGEGSVQVEQHRQKRGVRGDGQRRHALSDAAVAWRNAIR